jgi:pimeloyl-ACP methyl ester carboxylesterase
MSKDPLGFIARMNAISLMLITPEFYRIRRLRGKYAGRINYAKTNFDMKPEFKTIDELKIRIAKSERKRAPTILFLSPLPQSILCYDAIWSCLSGVANLVAVDLPGFGRSEGGKEYMSFDAQSAFLEQFINTQGLKDVHIVAPDIAMPVVLHYVIHRDHKVKSLMVGDGPGILPSKDGSLIKKIVGSGFWRTMVRLNGARTFIAGAMKLGYLHYSPTCDEVEDYVQSYVGRIGQVTAFFKQYPDGCNDLTDRIDDLKLPVKVFWGDEDAFLKVDNARLLHSRLSKSALHIFENCGHFSYQEQSSAFATKVQDWVVEEQFSQC